MRDLSTTVDEPITGRSPAPSGAPAPRRGVVVAVARWSATHRAVVLVAWALLVAGLVFAGGAVGTEQISDADSGAGASAAADRALSTADFGEPPVENVLVTAPDGTLNDASAAAVATEVRTRLGGLDGVLEVREPVRAEDGSALLVPIALDVTGSGDAADEQAAELVGPLQAATDAVQADHPDTRVELIGSSSIDTAIEAVIEDDFLRAELTSIPVTLAILLLAFGALVAAGVPVLLGISAVFAALGLSALVSQVYPVSPETSSVVLLIGLAVGVDYSLFAIRREREERARGAGKVEAIEIAAETSGRAVVVSGIAVAVAMSGMYLAGHPIFASFATGTILVVAVAVLASMTALPALLATLGDRIDRGRLPFVARWWRRRRAARLAAGRPSLSDRIVGAVLRRPAVSFVVAATALVALAVPALSMRTALPGEDDLPRSIPMMQTYDRMTAAFPGTGASHTVAFWSDSALPAADLRTAVADLADRTRAAGGFALGEEPELVLSDDGRVAYVDLPILDDPASDAAAASVMSLREALVAPAVAETVDGTDIRWGVTGQTAGEGDFDAVTLERLPLIFSLVLGVTFVVLLLAFGSVVVAGTAIALNLLSVGAAYGLLVLVFQNGWAEDLLGFRSNGAVVSWLPLFLFVVLFGLSMDYHVFVVSRIRENTRLGMSTREAVRAGITSTAGTVTSAAVIMVAVFSIFATLTLLDFKQLGVGLAAAILIDATVVRVVLLPAAMALLGQANWWTPRLLRR